MSVDSIARAGINAMTTIGIYGSTAKTVRHALDKLDGKSYKRKSKKKK